MQACAHVCVYISVPVCGRVHCVVVSLCALVRMLAHACASVCVRLWVLVRKYMCVHVCVRVHMHMCAHVCMLRRTALCAYAHRLMHGERYVGVTGRWQRRRHLGRCETNALRRDWRAAKRTRGSRVAFKTQETASGGEQRAKNILDNYIALAPANQKTRKRGLQRQVHAMAVAVAALPPARVAARDEHWVLKQVLVALPRFWQQCSVYFIV